MTAVTGNLTMETTGAEKEVAEGLKAAFNMEMEAVSGDGVKDEEGGDETLNTLGYLELLTQDAEPSRTTLVDAHNGFNNLSRLEMLWTVRHRWPQG